jgi:hypothetical protein
MAACHHVENHSFKKPSLRKPMPLWLVKMSGHFFFNERWFFDIGIYAAARLK